MLKKKGFTLIELLTVIAIIGILASIVIVNVSEARKRGRDARRKSDMGTLRSALEMYYEKNQEYPKQQNTAGEHCYTDGVNNRWCVSAEDFHDGDTGNLYYTTPRGAGGNPLQLWIYGLYQGQYLAALPLDPINKGINGSHNIAVDGNYFYLYKTLPNFQGYKLLAKFETDTNSMVNDGGIYNDPSGVNLYELFTPNARDLTNPSF